MFSSRKSQWLSIAALGLALFSAQASAALVFTFQRVSDLEAIMTATGSVDLQSLYPTGPNEGTYSLLELRGTLVPTGSNPLANGFVEEMPGNFNFGGSIPGWVVEQGDMLVSPNRFFDNDDSPSGTSFLKARAIDEIAWRPVGDEGRVWATYRAFTGGGDPIEVEIGTWRMTAAAVPEPGSLALVGVALFGLVPALRRRR